ncbi:flagellar assembly protein FliH [Photobacterium sp.]|uniref:flagellar assembly protein FliH n=1 Tax=Photobacterium sp. TaxID=660 RepID=UPI00299E20F3|nr:flagellar assembly protein FliH [Photobacterium sp.]MDX1301065.1 flagellar assembly protein FliH [Photobacterium sp.]
MKTAKVMRLNPGQYRLHRFPPVAEPRREPDSNNFDGGEDSWQDNQFDLQQRLEEGFQQGLQQGHDEGLQQGIKQGRQQGLVDGQNEGFQQGFVKGEQLGREGFTAAIQPVNELYNKLALWHTDKEREQRQQICDLVQKVAQQVIRAELTLMPQQILALVDETLEALPGKTDRVVVHLNPQDLERINNISTELPKSWNLVANKDLTIGSCQLVTDHAEADASCDARLETCMENVREHLLDDEVIKSVISQEVASE